jgi:hypothetical protein
VAAGAAIAVLTVAGIVVGAVAAVGMVVGIAVGVAAVGDVAGDTDTDTDTASTAARSWERVRSFVIRAQPVGAGAVRIGGAASGVAAAD